MTLTAQTLAAIVATLAARMPALEQELNKADARLGDGDTGTMLARVVNAIAGVAPPGEDVGLTLSAYAKATAMATGSSLGTLIATGLLAASRQTKGENEVAWNRVSPLLEAARDAMLSRGGASLGDKTVLDGLDAVAGAVEGLEDGQSIAAASATAAREALETFRDRPNRIGRARMFEDGSKGLDDPGMLALTRIIEIIGGE